MALPPEPIEELLSQASLIVEATVSEIVATGALPQKRPEGGNNAPSQVLILEIKQTLKGSCEDTKLKVAKPEAGYYLQPGNKGAFLLNMESEKWHIIGRHGPDSYSLDEIKQAL